jgi:NDP-sugar pyrophosphorylase family protein
VAPEGRVYHYPPTWSLDGVLGLKAVVLAAGEGRRLDPLTRRRPKPLLPVAGVPLIRRIAEQLEEAGVEEICVVTGSRGDALLEALRGLGRATVSQAIQDRPLGTAHALLAAKKFIGNERRFLLVYGDIFVDSSAFKNLASRLMGPHDGSILAILRDDPRRFGVLLEEGDVLKGIREKPEDISGTALVNGGVYLLPNEIIEAAERIEPSPRGEYELTDALLELVRRGRRISVYKHTAGYWLDIGTLANYIEANLLALSEPQRARARRPSLADPSAAVSESYIDANVRVGRGTVMKRAVAMQGSEIGDGSVVESSVLLEGALVESSSRLAYTIVAEDGVVAEESLLIGEMGRPVVVSPGSATPPRIRAQPGDVF